MSEHEIPWQDLDPEIIPLVRAMNQTGVLRTTGCCIGHIDGQPAWVTFHPTDGNRWQNLLFDLLRYSPDRCTVRIYQRYMVYERRPGEGERLNWEWHLELRSKTQGRVIEGAGELADWLCEWVAAAEDEANLRRPPGVFWIKTRRPRELARLDDKWPQPVNRPPAKVD